MSTDATATASGLSQCPPPQMAILGVNLLTGEGIQALSATSGPGPWTPKPDSSRGSSLPVRQSENLPRMSDCRRTVAVMNGTSLVDHGRR